MNSDLKKITQYNKTFFVCIYGNILLEKLLFNRDLNFFSLVILNELLSSIDMQIRKMIFLSIFLNYSFNLSLNSS